MSNSFPPKYSLIVFLFLLSACGGGGGGGGGGSGGATSPPPLANIAPTISGAPPNLINIGSSYDFTPTAQDADGDTLTFSVNNMPAWLQLNSASGQLTGTPTEQDAQNYSAIEITVTDSRGASASLPDFDLLVNSTPVIETTIQASYIEGSDSTLTALDSHDADGHDVTYDWQQTGGPTINIEDPSQASITLSIPLVDTNTDVSFILTLTDEYGAVSSTDLVFTITKDDSGPTVKDFVLLVSAEPTSATLAWLPAVDNATPENKMQYRLYASDVALFTPDASNLIASYQAEVSATVTGLTADTLYYFKLIAVDAVGNETMQTNYASITTASVSAVRSSEIVNESTSLHLGAVEISGTNNEIYTFIVNENTVEPDVGSFLIGQDTKGQGYLRKVVSVNNNQTTLTLETSQGSLTEVFENASFSTKTRLISAAEEQVTVSKSGGRQSPNSSVNRFRPYSIWEDQLLSITETGAMPHISSQTQKFAASQSTQGLKSTPVEISATAALKLTGDFFFEPVVKSDIELSFFSVDRYEADVSGHFSFDGALEFNFVGSATINEEKEVFTKTFTSKYLLGGVPVYQETILTLSAQFTAIAETAITATVDNHLAAEVSFSTVYENDVWTDTVSKEFDKSLTVTATVQGGVSAEVRLIPEVKLRFYKIASITASIEPFLSGDIEVVAVNQVDIIDGGALSVYGFTKFDSAIGVDVNFYTDLTILSTIIARYPESGVKNLYTEKWRLFGLPELKINEITSQDPPSIHSAMTLSGHTTPFTNDFGDPSHNNPIDVSSLEWATFSDNSIGTGSDFSWQPDTHGKIFRVYFIGNSVKLGGIGQQFQMLEVDMRDSDADGMPNAWEDVWMFNPLSAVDAGEDFDSDGVTNLQEYIASTNPKDSNCNFDDGEAFADNTRILDSDIGEYLGAPGAGPRSFPNSKSYFTPRLKLDGTWVGYLSRWERYVDEVLVEKLIYQPFETEDGCVINYQSSRTTFLSAGVRNEESYSPHKRPDGLWVGVKDGLEKSFYPSDAKRTIDLWVAKQNDDGSWLGLLGGIRESYYESGGPKERSPMVIKKVGESWQSTIEGIQEYYYEYRYAGSNIWERHAYTTILVDMGNWLRLTSVKHGASFGYYCNGDLAYTAVYEYDDLISLENSENIDVCQNP